MVVRRCRAKKLALVLIFWIPVLFFYIGHADKTRTVQIQKPRDNVTVVANYDKTPTGGHLLPGEGGYAVRVPYNKKKLEEQGYKEHAFNKAASDMISVERSLRNYRNKK